MASFIPARRPDDIRPLGLKLPKEVEPVENQYAQRAERRREELLETMGGSHQTEEAVDRALRWLADHQSADGHWDGRDFDADCGECGGESEFEVHTAVTGLALLCFLGADHTHTKDGPYRDHIERGIQWLVDQQRRNGDLRGFETLYSHGIATIALSEALGMTGDSRLVRPVERAVRFIHRARNRDVGGWRYDPGQPGDTSVLGWQVMALRSAQKAGVDVPMESYQAARRWMRKVASPTRPGLYAYQPGREPSETMTAEGMFVQQLLGHRAEEPTMQRSADFILEHLPDWDRHANTYFWYYATLSLFQHQGDAWQRWNKAVTRELLGHQVKNGAAAGSWSPEGEWANVGGRVCQTAMCTLMLEVYYRYLPMYVSPMPQDAIGTIQGVVTSAESHEPLAGVAIRLVLPDAMPISVITDSNGAYTLHVPDVPDFFALSASVNGFIPDTVNVNASLVAESTLTVDFDLHAVDPNVVVIESLPDVHHLGDDAFTGSINSRFQRRAEGDTFRARFRLTAAQLTTDVASAQMHLLVKGVQRPHPIRINGQLLDRRLNRAPRDGSFGGFAAEFPPEMLRVGDNVLEIHATAWGGDIDDFEFVNLQIRLLR